MGSRARFDRTVGWRGLPEVRDRCANLFTQGRGGGFRDAVARGHRDLAGQVTHTNLWLSGEDALRGGEATAPPLVARGGQMEGEDAVFG